jgi:hypothetical protein
MTDLQRARAQARYELHRDAEAARMARLRDQLDEVWEDDEDPLTEAQREAALRYREWVASL